MTVLTSMTEYPLKYDKPLTSLSSYSSISLRVFYDAMTDL